MPRKHPFLYHSVVTVILAGILSAIFVQIRPYTEAVFREPSLYIGDTVYTDLELQYVFVSVAGIVIFILLSYIIYLIVTSRTRMQAAIWAETKSLALSREQFRRVYDHAPIPYLLLTAQGEIREPNKAALRFFGLKEEELEGIKFFDFVPEDDKERADQLLNQYRSASPINNQEIQMKAKDGDVRYVSLSIFDMNDPVTSTRTGLATILDVSEQKKLSKAKTEFMSLTSHQLRTPLATFKWYTDMLASGDLGELSPKQLQYVSTLHNVNQDMIELVETLLNVSRMELGSLIVEKKTCNLQETVESILLELSSQIHKKSITIVREFGNALKSTDTDPKLMRIVIQNLISNAIKYTPEGGKVIVSLEENGRRKITVSDTGLGIPQHQQDKVFTKLFRAENVHSISSSQSTGLGLYLVKSVVETLGGSIAFVSEENKGSEFTITF